MTFLSRWKTLADPGCALTTAPHQIGQVGRHRAVQPGGHRCQHQHHHHHQHQHQHQDQHQHYFFRTYPGQGRSYSCSPYHSGNCAKVLKLQNKKHHLFDNQLYQGTRSNSNCSQGTMSSCTRSSCHRWTSSSSPSSQLPQEVGEGQLLQLLALQCHRFPGAADHIRRSDQGELPFIFLSKVHLSYLFTSKLFSEFYQPVLFRKRGPFSTDGNKRSSSIMVMMKTMVMIMTIMIIDDNVQFHDDDHEDNGDYHNNHFDDNVQFDDDIQRWGCSTLLRLTP